MRNQFPVRSTQFSFPMWKCAIALLCCAFSIEPLFAQTLNWAYYGNDVSNSRFQNIDQINPSNVAQLKPAWIFLAVASTPSSILAMEMTPIVVDGVMYVTTGADDVYALNAATGKQIWAYHPTDMPALSTLDPQNVANRGVAYGQGLIFDARLDAKLVALNAKTGAVVWEQTVDLPSNHATMTLAPQFIRASEGAVPEVLVGISCESGGVRGHLDAYDPATGKLLWRFWTTEPHSWEGDSYLNGGAPVWMTPTYDPVLNMVYFSTGDPYPLFYGGARAGTNLYADSIVAVDATTGELQWFFQETHHDTWDLDSAQPTVLFNWNGIPAISETSKTGYMWILDRASGEPLFPYQEAAIPPTPVNAAFDTAFEKTWPIQPESSIESLTVYQADALSAGADALPAGYTAAPSIWTPIGPTPMVFQHDVVEWPPAAYSPRTNFIYSHYRYDPRSLAATNDPATDPDCQRGHTASLCGVAGFFTVPGVYHGLYGAVNILTGKVAWTIPLVTSAPDSGMAVAGDLVFMGDDTGLFYAASAATGEILWVFDAATVPNAGGADASPAIYEINGVEYVVYGFGGNPGQIHKSFLVGDAVIAFALPSAVAAAAEKSAAGRARVK
jgi:quinohemoprotein ethanol dehydrogenase